jgi:hypothetical protein
MLIPDYRVLVAVAYTPIVLIGAPFGWPPGVCILDVFPWPVVNQFVCIAGGLLWFASAAAYGRRSRGACESCGRDDADAGETTPDAAPRWGRWATYAAVIVPMIYAVTRWAWALGFPLGISEEFLRKGQESGKPSSNAKQKVPAVAQAPYVLQGDVEAARKRLLGQPRDVRREHDVLQRQERVVGRRGLLG